MPFSFWFKFQVLLSSRPKNVPKSTLESENLTRKEHSYEPAAIQHGGQRIIGRPVFRASKWNFTRSPLRLTVGDLGTRLTHNHSGIHPFSVTKESRTSVQAIFLPWAASPHGVSRLHYHAVRFSFSLLSSIHKDKVCTTIMYVN